MKHTLKTLCCVFVVLSLFLSCNKNRAERLTSALDFAGENRIELEKVLEHYKDSGLKYQAACFLIENMPRCYSETGWQLDTVRLLLSHIEKNEVADIEARKKWRGVELESQKVYDAHVITANYLIHNIERAFDAWHSRTWNKYLPFEDFCELILPYRAGNEPLEEWWTYYKDKYTSLLDSVYKGTDVIEATNVVRDSINKEGFRYCSDFNISNLGASYLFKNRIGKCGDSCDFLLYTMRSLGIPVATDTYLYASETRTGHSWHVVRDTTGDYLSFAYTEKSRPIRGKIYSDWRKIGKAYRECFGLQEKSVPAWDKGNIPADLDHSYLKDVSADYFKDSLTLELKNIPNEATVYLGIFKRDTWHVIDHSVLEKGKVCFKNIEAQVVYMPLLYDGEKLHEIGYPFYFDGQKNHPFIPDEKVCQTVELLRKNPYYYWLKDIAGRTIGGRFEVSDDSDFRRKKVLYAVCDTPKIDYNLISLSAPVKVRYARYVVPEDMDAEMAEMSFMYQGEVLRPAKVEGDPGENSEVSPQKLVDGDPLTCFKSKEKGGAAILDFGMSKWIDGFVYVPRNGDNCIRIGDTYELFYQGGAKGWISLGVKIATEPRLIYDNMPQGALFYLRNLHRGVEELAFFIENGKQKFLTVLEDRDLGCYK